MHSTFTALVMAAAIAPASPVSAHDETADIDEMIGSSEKFFQVIDEPAPPFQLADPEGTPVRLSDFSDKVVVLNFVFASCTDVCPLQSALIADVQANINASPMKDMVQFITVTTDPAKDTPDVLKSYGEAHGLDPYNWMFLTAPPGAAEDATRKLADTYDQRFDPLPDGQQMHGVVTHVIDRDGRFAAKFHGLRFEPVNLVLYVNGLINSAHEAGAKREPGWRDWLEGLF